MFKGMVERCADCGFDLAAGRVPVVPTAHYMMGGVEFNLDGSTAAPVAFQFVGDVRRDRDRLRRREGDPDHPDLHARSALDHHQQEV